MAAVKVFLRERPSENAPKYTYEQQDGCVYVTTTTPSFHSRTAHSYVLDGVFDGFYGYEDVFNVVGRPAVVNVLNSYSATLICYGATSTGKSYTAFGEDGKPGLAFQVLDYLFESAAARQQRETCDIYVSLTEIYIDKVFDLFNGNPLQIRQDEGGFYCENLTQIRIDGADQAKQLLDKTLKNRQTAPNYANQTSSRSHVLFSIGVVRNSREDNVYSQAILTVCDLAGSESLRKSNASGLRLMEAYYINKSLSALCAVVNQLAAKNQFIQYRDSKLTMLLYKSLGGNSFTSVICTVFADYPEESQYTIQFANRCRNVLNNPQVQYTDIAKIEQNALIQKLQKENLELKSRIGDLEAELAKKFPEDKLANLVLVQNGAYAYQTEYFASKNTTYYAAKTKQTMQTMQTTQAVGAAKATNAKYQIYSQMNGSEEPARKDSIAILRLKLITKNEEMQAQMHSFSKYLAEYRTREHQYKERILDLQEYIKTQQEAHVRQLSDAKAEKDEALRKISAGADELIQTQRSIAESTLRLVPDKQQQAMDEFDVAQMLEQEKIQISAQLDVYQLEYREELLFKHQKDIEQLRQQHKSTLDAKNHEIAQMKADLENCQYAVCWLGAQFKAMSNVVMNAREGKIDSFIVNEPEVIYYLMYYQGDIGSTLKRERTRIHTCLILDDSQLPKIPPERVSQVLAKCKPVNRPYSSLSASSRPNSAFSLKELRKSGQVYQPHMQTGFIKPKAPNITLGMNVHISPRPQSAMSQKIATSHGSCGGTQELVNKQYQYWGW